VVGEASNGREAISRVESLRPDVILMDLVMPEMDGIEAIRRITARQPEARILVLTSFATDDKVFPAIKAGALGYLLKDSDHPRSTPRSPASCCGSCRKGSDHRDRIRLWRGQSSR
jgi:DNA-binding NarL/FixJ family response regulator